MHQVFISHSSKNKKIADAICSSTESKGLQCWIAPRDIQPGVSYGEAILDAIKHCSVMVVILSKEANVSRQVQKEVERAVSTGKKIIPFRIDDIPLSKSLEYFLSSEHWLDAVTPPIEDHIEKLVSTILRDMAGRAIGRERELSFADDLLNRTKEKNGNLLYISGDAGIGKSYLCERIISLAKAKDFKILSAAAHSSETIKSYSLWQQIIYNCASIGLETSSSKAERESAQLHWRCSRP